MTTTSEDLNSRIESLQNEIQDKQRQLAALRRERAAEPVADYRLQTSEGDVSLSELFGNKQDLILVHNMGRRCPYCTLWADGFTGLKPHLEDRAAFVLCSPDDPQTQAEFARSRGWTFRMVSDPPPSSGETDFTAAMGYRFQKEGQKYHAPGYSTFRKHADGSITRVAHDRFGPGDAYCGLWHMFEHLHGGTGDWQARFEYD